MGSRSQWVVGATEIKGPRVEVIFLDPDSLEDDDEALFSATPTGATEAAAPSTKTVVVHKRSLGRLLWDIFKITVLLFVILCLIMYFVNQGLLERAFPFMNTLFEAIEKKVVEVWDEHVMKEKSNQEGMPQNNSPPEQQEGVE